MSEEKVLSAARSVQGVPKAAEMVASASQDARPSIFLASVAKDVAEKFEMMKVMLDKAGYNVITAEKLRPGAGFSTELQSLLEKADASLHMLGGSYGETLPDDPRMSVARLQFDLAYRHADRSGEKFKVLVWSVPQDGMIMQLEQQDFLNAVQNNLTPQVMFTGVNNAAQLIDDMRTFLGSDGSETQVVKEYDIAFISNVEDAGDCYNLIEELGKEHKINTLTVIPEQESDYRSRALEVVRKSHLAVIYFKEASDWAIAFTKQVWKVAGGASSSTPFLVIGEDEPRRNRFLSFNAPNVKFQVLPSAEILPSVQTAFATTREGKPINDRDFSPYTGLRPFNEEESIFFTGRERHIDTILEMLKDQKFVMVTGSSGDGKSSLLYAGVIPNLKGGFLRTQYSKWAVADFRPERHPLRNMSHAVAKQLRIRNADDVENTLSYGFSALVDLYKQSPLYVDITSETWLNADEDERKHIKRQAANLLILVDQFEELFTNVENYRDGVASPLAQITVNVLSETIRIAREEDLPIFIVFTMRSDYIGQCVAFRGFAEMIGLSTYFVPRLKREEIQQVIQVPAKLNGDQVTLRLTQRLLNDLGDGLDQLPVLQHTLNQIWTTARKEGKVLDLIHYAKVAGLAKNRLPRDEEAKFDTWFATLNPDIQALYERPKLRNVLNRHANELFLLTSKYLTDNHGMKVKTEEVQQILKIAFTGLTKIDENRAVRNRMNLQEITDLIGRDEWDYQAVGRALNIFREPGNTFVQPYITDDSESRELAPNAVLDITHEALIRNWDKLTEWAETEHKSVAIYEDFKVQVNRWLDNDCSTKYLLNAGAFSYFDTWYQELQPTPAWIRRYIRPDEMIAEMEPMEQATQYLDDIDEYLLLSRQRIQRNRRLVMATIVIISALLVVAMIAAFYANAARARAVEAQKIAEMQRLEAEKQKSIADRQRFEAEIQRLLAENATLEAQIQADIAEMQKEIALGQKLEADRQKLIAQKQAMIAQNQKKIADFQSEIEKIDVQLQKQLTYGAQLNNLEAQIQGEISFIQKQNALVLQSLFLAQLAQEQVEQDANPTVAMLLALEGLPKRIGDENDRPYVEEAEASLYLAINDLVNATPISTMQGHRNHVIFNQFSPDGKFLVTTSWDRTARLWDVETGREVDVLTGHSHIVDKAYFSEDSRFIVTLAEDFTARLWDFNAKRQKAVLSGHANLLTYAAISADGHRVVTTSIDKTARLWNTHDGKTVATLKGHTGAVNYAAFSRDGNRVVTVSADSTARLWSAVDGNPIALLTGHSGEVNSAAFSPDGKYVVTVAKDNTARLWDGNTGLFIRTLGDANTQHKAPVNYAAFSNKGDRLATVSDDGRGKVWDVATGRELGVLREHTAGIYHVSWGAKDERIVTTSRDKSVRLYDGTSYLPLCKFTGHPTLGYQGAISSDGTMLAVAAPGFSVKVVKVFPPGQALLDKANELAAGRKLTDNERVKFFLKNDKVLDDMNSERIVSLRKDKIVLQQEAQAQETVIQTLPPKQQFRDQIIETEGLIQQLSQGGGMPELNSAPTGTPSTNAWQPEMPTNRSNINPSSNQVPPSSVAKPQPIVKNGKKVHVVKTGDTLAKIANQYGISVQQLIDWNNLHNNQINIFQELVVSQ